MRTASVQISQALRRAVGEGRLSEGRVSEGPDSEGRLMRSVRVDF